MISIIDVMNSVEGFVRPLREGEEVIKSGLVPSVGLKENREHLWHVQALVFRTSGIKTENLYVLNLWIDNANSFGEKVESPWDACAQLGNPKNVDTWRFPKDSKLVQKWVHATRAQYLKEIKSHHKVCSGHFEKHCILNHFGATRLAPGAIPTLFEWNRPSVGERGTQAQNTTPFLAIRSISRINNAQSNNRVILPKTTLQGSPVPKVRIPPLVKRIPLPVSKCAAFDLIKSKPLMCDVILPERRKTSNHQSTGSTILCYEAPTSNPVEPNDLDSDDDRGSNGSEYVLGDIGNYTLSTKKSNNYEEEDEEEVDDPLTKGSASDDGSNHPLLAENCSRESSNSGSSLIDEIVESLQDDTADHFRDVKDIPMSNLEDVIIEECSIIEEEIIPPEKAGTPLSLAVYLKEKNLSLASKEVNGEHVVRKSAVDETISAKSPNLETTLQTSTKKRQPESMVSPMIFQVGNMVASPLIKTTQVAVQNKAPNLVNLIAPQMTYLIPFGGVIPPPLALKTSNVSNTGELMISRSGQNVIIPPEAASPKNKLQTSRKIRQKKRASCDAVSGNEKTLNGKNCPESTCRSIESNSTDGRNTNEERSSQKIKEMKIVLKKKDMLLKKLKKDKMNLAQKLRTLRRAFLKLRKATIVNLSSTKYLEAG